MVNGKKIETLNNAIQADCNVEEQYELAKLLAANCGYQLVAEDDERSLAVKQILVRMKADGPAVVDNGDRELIMEGLEALLKQ